MQAFDTVRIKGDAQSGQPRSLTEYLDELKSDAERMDESSAALAARFDALIRRQGRATED